MDEDRDSSEQGRTFPRSPLKAVLASFVWPGLGQWYLGQRIAALVYAIPPLLIVIAGLSLAADGLESLAARILDPAVALTVLGGIVLSAVWRLVSMADAWWVSRRREGEHRQGPSSGAPRGRVARDVAAVLALAAIVVVVHAAPASLAVKFYQAGSVIFQPDDKVAARPTARPSAAPTAPTGPSPSPVIGSTPGPSDTPPPPPATPIPTISPDVTDDGLVNVLFIGTDSLPGRPPDHRLADSITLASFDRVEGTIDMVSVPRNVSRFPQYWGGLHEGKINTLISQAQADPSGYPDGPLETFVQQVSYLLGVDIDYYATVDVPGFQRLIDAVGGIEVEVTEPIADPDFPLYLDAGRHQLDGVTAMMYVRSRKGPGGSNEQRSYRQQQVLLELRRKLSDPAMLPRLPEILDAMAGTVRSNLPAGQLDETLGLAREATDAQISHAFLGPETFARELPATETDLENAVELRLDAVAALSKELWGDVSYYSDPSYLDELMAVQATGSR